MPAACDAASTVVAATLDALQEAAAAWKAQCRLLVMTGCSGLTPALAGPRLDGRGGSSRAPVMGAATAAEAVQLVSTMLADTPGPS
jgi:hypothetical protein